MNAIDYIIGIVFLIVYFIFSHLGDEDDTTSRFSILIYWLVALGVSFLFGIRLVSSIYGHFLTSNESVMN